MRIRKYIRDNLKRGYKALYIKDWLIGNGFDRSFVDKEFSTYYRFKAVVAFLVVILVVMGIALFNPSITGYTTYSVDSYYSENVSFDSDFIWNPVNDGRLVSISVKGSGMGRVYFEDSLLYSSYVEEELENLFLEHTLNSSVVGVRSTIEGSCIEWSVYDYLDNSLVMICRGTEECCEFFELSSLGEYNETFYVNYDKYGAGYKNKINARILVFENGVPIWQSNVSSVAAVFGAEESFEESLEVDLSQGNYSFVLEGVEVNRIDYTIREERIGNTAPSLVEDIPNVSSSVLDLGEYFIDVDGDDLEYSYYQAVEGLIISFDSDEATISGLPGTYYTYITANDSNDVAFSNVFEVSISEGVGVMESNIDGSLANMTSWIGLVNSTTGMIDYKTTLYYFQDIYFLTNYVNKSSGSVMSNASCTINFSDSTAYNMSYESVGSPYYYFNKSFAVGNYSYTVNCSLDGYDNLTVNEEFSVLDYGAGFEMNIVDAPTTTYSSLVLGDIDNDEDMDLIYTGESGSLNEIRKCVNSGSGFDCSALDDIGSVKYGSMSLGDIDNDGDLDLAYCGENTSADGAHVTNIYKNENGAFVFYENVSGVSKCSLQLGDLDNDGKLDLGFIGSSQGDFTNKVSKLYKNKENMNYFTNLESIYEGTFSWMNYNQDAFLDLITTGYLSSENQVTRLYLGDGNNISISNNMVGYLKSSIGLGDLNNDGLTDIIISGSEDQGGFTGIVTIPTRIYYNNGSGFIQNGTLTAYQYASISIGDINNDGLNDVVLCGSGCKVYIHNGTGLEEDISFSIDSIESGSIVLFDYGEDGDLDLATVGGGKNLRVYENSVASIRNNTAPNSPSQFNSSFDGTWLNLTWNNGTDDITPKLGLYYNLRVGTAPGGNDIISGKYGGSSNPTQGYLGNMMQLHNYAVNVSLNRTYFWQVQTIDNGLKSGEWSSIQSYDPCPYNGGNWTVATTCMKFNETIIVNGSLNIQEGNLLLINSSIIFNGSSGGINLISGSLIINSSNISSNNGYNYTFRISNITSFEMRDSYLSGSNGIELNSSNITFNNNVLTNNVYGIIFNTENAEISDSIINSSIYDIYSNGNNNSVLNITFTNKSVASGYFNVKWHLGINVANATGSNLQGVRVSAYNVDSILIKNMSTNSNGYVGLELIEYMEYGNSTNYYSNYTINFYNKSHNQYNVNINLTGNALITQWMNKTSYPTYDEFDLVTDFNAIDAEELDSVDDVYIGNSNYGMINFSEDIDVAGQNLNELIEFGSNSIYLNPIPQLNKKAVLTLFNLNYTFMPAMMKDGAICSDCSALSYNDGVFVFNVTGFSTYSASLNSKLAISVTNGYSDKVLPNEMVYFYANYTNRTSGLSVNGSGVSCYIDYGGYTHIDIIDPVAMEFNSSSGVYYHNKSFMDLRERSYTIDYNVSCYGNSLGYENLSSDSNFDVEMNVTLLSWNSEYELATLDNKGSMALADLDNNSWVDVVTMGQIGTTDYALNLSHWNGSEFNKTPVSNSYGLIEGSIALNDYDKDSDLDIIAIGKEVIGSDRQVRIYKKE